LQQVVAAPIALDALYQLALLHHTILVHHGARSRVISVVRRLNLI
jgi:hypothetical protein